VLGLAVGGSGLSSTGCAHAQAWTLRQLEIGGVFPAWETDTTFPDTALREQPDRLTRRLLPLRPRTRLDVVSPT
jgi:hypothetical protein